jgi:hypothetical protein
LIRLKGFDHSELSSHAPDPAIRFYCHDENRFVKNEESGTEYIDDCQLPIAD